MPKGKSDEIRGLYVMGMGGRVGDAPAAGEGAAMTADGVRRFVERLCDQLGVQKLRGDAVVVFRAIEQLSSTRRKGLKPIALYSK